MRLLPTTLASVLAVGMAASALVAEAETGFRVAIHGDDTSAGTVSDPFRTLNRACDAIRAVKNSDGQIATASP